MKRLLVPAALAALIAGCALPDLSGLVSRQSDMTDSAPAAAPTVIVREIEHETPVVYVDTVYMEEEPAPAETVYVAEEYETVVYVPEPVYLPPPPPRHHHPRWSPPPPHPDGDHGSRKRHDPPDNPKPPKKPDLPPAKQRTYLPVTDGHQKSPDRPNVPARPTTPANQALGKAVSVPVQLESPKKVPTAPAGDAASTGTDAVPGQAGTSQLGTGPVAARSRK